MKVEKILLDDGEYFRNMDKELIRKLKAAGIEIVDENMEEEEEEDDEQDNSST